MGGMCSRSNSCSPFFFTRRYNGRGLLIREKDVNESFAVVRPLNFLLFSFASFSGGSSKDAASCFSCGSKLLSCAASWTDLTLSGPNLQHNREQLRKIAPSRHLASDDTTMAGAPAKLM